MPPLEHAALLMRKAQQDEYAVRKFISDPAAPDELIGFHAQQSIEKMLKAVLAFRSIPYRRTHDLIERLDLLRDNAVMYPGSLEEVRRLTPFAVALRYDDIPEESDLPFDRSWVLDCLAKVRAWSESELGRSPR